ncbi:multiple sugar transport system substrate-binding protein [Anaeroplasma bactoclasticum]|jgi:ABC-type glycerol-3-phosphate transport system substrate-binding protein|uniref:Multiple sugar transport system substrate-binding protein n=1 Tax=Anaeroplasma bactoclasticum TaxID=2088 RepID=A0A397RVD0_9MOLU|nr:extracellular solute-binding protein [Anaeroplasma bactoclasticum]RIA75567.1 multiple sugar transport system substrate-binding protein [Anaeroplasma bactoclasticum]
MKKVYLGVATLFGFAALALASCGGDSNATKTGNTETTTDGGSTTTTEAPIPTGLHEDKTLDLTATLNTSNFSGSSEDKTIVFYHTMGDSLQETLQVAIDAFNAKYPDWTIEHSQIGRYNDVRSRCIAGLAAGNQPDLAYCYADHVAQYLKTGKVVDMSDYVNATGTLNGERIGYTEEELADFVQGYYKEGFATNYGAYAEYGYKDGDILTFPFVKSTEVLYYNKDALDAAGLTVPTTWDELWAACETLNEVYPKCTPLGYDSEANWVITMAEQNGWGYTSAAEPHFLFNNNNLANWLDDLYEKYEDYYFTTQTENGGYTSGLFVKGPENGGTVFSIGSSGGASHQATDDFTWGVAPMPGSVQADGTVNSSAISQGPSLVMFQSEAKNETERQLMTWEFVKCLEDATFQAAFSMTSGYNPTRISTFSIDEYADFLEGESIVAVTAGVAATMSDRFYTSPAFSGSSTARDQMEAALLYVIRGQKTGAEALADAYKACGGK